MKNNKHILFVLICVVYYLATRAIVFYLIRPQPGSLTAITLELLRELGAALMILYYIRRYASWQKVGYGKTNWLRLLWIVPILVPVLVYAGYTFSTIGTVKLSSTMLIGIVLIGVMDFLVGFGEETLWRGIFLRGEMGVRNVFLAMLVSSLVFSLVHFDNLLQDPWNDVISQVISAFTFSLCMAPLALLLGNLAPLVVYHFIWDFSLEALAHLPEMPNPVMSFEVLKTSVPAIEIILAVIAWVVLFVKWRRGAFRKE